MTRQCDTAIKNKHRKWMRNKFNRTDSNNNEKFRSFKSKENIQKKEVGPYHGFGYLSLISDPIHLAKGARGKYCEFASFNTGSRLKD